MDHRENKNDCEISPQSSFLHGKYKAENPILKSTLPKSVLGLETTDMVLLYKETGRLDAFPHFQCWNFDCLYNTVPSIMYMVLLTSLCGLSTRVHYQDDF